MRDPGEAVGVPVIRFRALERDRLRTEPERSPLTLLRAPAGFGKTTLAIQWLSDPDDEAAACWVRTPRTDGDPSVLWCAVLDALRRSSRALRARGRALRTGGDGAAADPPASSAARDAVEGIVRDLRAPLVLVLDDYENATDAGLDLTVAELLSLSPHLFLVVIARRVRALDGPLVASRIPVTILGADELAFTPQEIDRLAELRGLETGVPESVDRMTRGWPVAVHLAIDGLLAGHSARERRNALTRFAQESLEATADPEAGRVFAMIALCENVASDILTGETGDSPERVATRLRTLEDRGLITAEWFPGGPRYRSHPGYAEAFEPRAVAMLGEETARRLRRAHALQLAADDPDGAMVQLLGIGDYETATRLLASHFLIVMEPSARFVEAVRMTPLSHLTGHTVLTAALMLVEMVNPRTPRDVIDRIYAQLRASAENDLALGQPESLVPSLAALIVTERIRGASTEALRLALDLETRLLHVPDHDLAALADTMSFIHAIIALTAILGGDLELAERAFTRTLAAADGRGNEAEQLRAWNGLAVVAALAGETDRARERLARADEMVRRHGIWGPQLSWLNRHLARAVLAVDDLDAEAFRAAADPAEPLLVRAEQAPLFVIAEAHLRRAEAGEYAALVGLRERTRQMTGMVGLSRALRIELAVIRAVFTCYAGGWAAAEEMLGDLPADYPAVRLAASRVALFRGDAAAAQARAEALLDATVSVRVRTQALLVAAVAAAGQDREEEAIAHLAAAAPDLRRFGPVSLGTVPFDALRALGDAAAEQGCDLRAEIEALPDTLRPIAREPLTRAEVRTLRAFDVHRTNAQVADALFVSRDTVKTHLRSIYRKLGVSSRLEARRRAEAQGLVSEEPREE